MKRSLFGRAAGRASMPALEALAMTVVLATAASAASAGCDGDNGDGDTPSSVSAGPTTSSSSASSGAGGAGGEGQGGSGGAVDDGCLDPSTHADFITIEDSSLCAVAIYTADAAIATYESSPTWGSHGGLLTVAKGAAMGSLELTRWTAPSGVTGKLTAKTSSVAAAIPGDWFAGAQAIDLPFFGWTAASWTAKFPATGGELLLLKGDAIDDRYDVNGFFAGAGLGASAEGRLLYSGLSALDKPMDDVSGLYAADSCGAAAQDPRLVPDGDPACGAPAAVATWGESSGPIATDRAGNAFAIMASFSTMDQEARGFEASTVARGAPPSQGATLFKTGGFGAALAAIAPAANDPGILAFQPSDATSYDPLDVIAQRYTVAAKSVKAEGNTSVLLKLAKPATFLTLTTDDQDRLWVGGSDGASGARFVVVARTPK